MATRDKYLQKWLRLHARYERKAYHEIKAVFAVWGRQIPWDKLTEINYKSQIESALNNDLMLSALKVIYTEIGTEHGIRVGRDINADLKAFEPVRFLTVFQMDIQKFLLIYGMKKVVTIHKSYFDEINVMINGMLQNGDDMMTISAKMKKAVTSPLFYRWQALRIARTETTGASNYGASIASGVVNYVIEKEWISGADGRTRMDHAYADSQKVLEHDSFNVGGERMKYPGDPNGSAGNVINCRCTIALRAKRDSDGNLIPLN